MNIIEYFTNIVPLDQKEISYLKTIGKIKIVPKNTYILSADKICNFVAFIKSGIFRSSQINENGKEFTIKFSLENNFATDYSSFLSNQISSEFIFSLEDSEVVIISKKELLQLFSFSYNFQKIGRIITENIYMQSYKRLKEFLIDDAETKYKKLVCSQPELFTRISHHHIASYIGITPETLSRIRKKNYNIDIGQ